MCSVVFCWVYIYSVKERVSYNRDRQHHKTPDPRCSCLCRRNDRRHTDRRYIHDTHDHPGHAPLNVTATGYAWNNNTVVTVSSGVINASGNVTLMPEKVTLALKSDETAPIKSAPNSTQVIFNLTATNYGTNATFTVTDSTIVNVTANESTIIGVEIDTGYGIILINVTVEPEGSGKPEIHGGTNATVTTRNITSVDIYTDVLIEDLILRQTDDETVRKNQSQTINASDTVKCDLTVNMAEPARINITETGINPDGECTESTLPDAVSDWIPVGSFICIRHNTSGTGSFTIRRYYDPSLNYTGVHIYYYYNTTPNPSEWERLELDRSCGELSEHIRADGYAGQQR